MPVGGGIWNSKALLKRFGVALGILGIAGLLWTFGRESYKAASFPRSPDPAVGRIFPDNVHGIVIYETRSQKRNSYYVEVTSFSMLGLSLVLSLIYRKRGGAQTSKSEPGNTPTT